MAIAPRVVECLKAFKELSLELNGNKAENSKGMPAASIVEELGRFRVWAGNAGAHRLGRSALDYRLQDASHIQKRILELLSDLQRSLTDASAILRGERIPWDEMSDESTCSDSEEEDASPTGILAVKPLGSGSTDLLEDSEMHQLMADIVNVNDCLFKISIAIRNPAPHDRFLKSAYAKTSLYEDFDIRHVRDKYPHADDFIVTRLGKAISRRRQYFNHRTEHHDKLAFGLDEEEREAPQSTIASSLPEKMRTSGPSKFDSGIYDEETLSESGVSQTSFATSQGDDTRRKLPAMPATAVDGKPFQCPLCYRIVAVRSSFGWKKHVYGDLRPYVCLFKGCKSPNLYFHRRHHWLSHESQNHRREWICPDPCQKRLGSETEFRNHLTHEHAADYATDQLPAIVNTSQRPALVPDSTECPLCKEELGSANEAQRHIGRHQEELALFALPSGLDDEEGDSDNDDQSKSVGAAGTEDEEEPLEEVMQPGEVEPEYQVDPLQAEIGERIFSDKDEGIGVNQVDQFSPDEEDLSSKPRCQRCRKSKKGCDRQRPCGRCKDADIGIEGCLSEDEGDDREGRYGRHMGVPVNTRTADETVVEIGAPSSSAAHTAELKRNSDVDDSREESHSDVLVLKHRREQYRVHFPFNSIDGGKLRVADIRAAAASKTNSQPNNVKLFYKGRNLKDDTRLARDEGFFSGRESELLCVVSGATVPSTPPIDGGSEEESREVDSSKDKCIEKETSASTHSAPATTATPLTPLDKVNALNTEFWQEKVPLCMTFIENSPADRKKRESEYKKLSETILGQILFKLDEVDLGGNAEARTRRKEVVRDVQGWLNLLDDTVKRGPLRASHSGVDYQSIPKIERPPPHNILVDGDEPVALPFIPSAPRRHGSALESSSGEIASLQHVSGQERDEFVAREVQRSVTGYCRPSPPSPSPSHPSPTQDTGQEETVSQVPHPYYRSSSISMQSQLPPSRIETPPQEGARENRTLSANPYAQVQPPPSITIDHTDQSPELPPLGTVPVREEGIISHTERSPTPPLLSTADLPEAVSSPGNERLARLEALVEDMVEATMLKRLADQAALRTEEDRKKKQKEEKIQSEKLVLLEELLRKQNEEAIAYEKAIEKDEDAVEASAAERAARENIAEELRKATEEAKTAAEEQAEKLAKEAKEAEETVYRELMAMKEKRDAAEAAKGQTGEDTEGSAAEVAPKAAVTASSDQERSVGLQRREHKRIYDIEHSTGHAVPLSLPTDSRPRTFDRLQNRLDDSYSYTDPARMYHDTEPRWRQRRGSFDELRKDRPISMLDATYDVQPRYRSAREISPPPSTRDFTRSSGLRLDYQHRNRTARDFGPPPSTRGFDKINESSVMAGSDQEPRSSSTDRKPGKGILRPSTTNFPEDPNPVREGVAPLHDEDTKGVPKNARWTKIDRRLVNPEALEEAKERFEERADCVIVLRVLTKDEIQKLADRTKQLRDDRTSKESAAHWQKERENKRVQTEREKEWELKQATKKEAAEEGIKAEEEKLIMEMHKRLTKFGFREDQIEAMVDPKKAKQLKPGASPGIVAKPTYIKVHKNHLSVDTLAYYNIPYEIDSTDRDYIIILQEMSTAETDTLFEHTRPLRKPSQLNIVETRGPASGSQYGRGSAIQAEKESG